MSISTGASFYLPNGATDIDGCIAVMYENILVLKHLCVMVHQVSGSQ